MRRGTLLNRVMRGTRAIELLLLAIVAGACSGQVPAGEPVAQVDVGLASSQEQKLAAPDPGRYFGFGTDVAIEGDTAFVFSVKSHDVYGAVHSGALYIFARSGASWALAQQLKFSDDPTPYSASLALSGSAALVLVGTQPTVVHVLERPGSTWFQTQTLEAPPGATFYSVALKGDTAMISGAGEGGTPRTWVYRRAASGWAEEAVLSRTGSIFLANDSAMIDKVIFARSGSDWVEEQELVVEGVSPNSYTRTAFDGETAVVGIVYDDADSIRGRGAAYVFTRSGSTFVQQQKLTASDGAASEFFSNSIAVAGDVMVLGAPYHTHGGQNSEHGSAYVFVRSGSTWTEARELRATDYQNNDHFGQVVALSGNSILIGAPNDDAPFQGQGAAYVFRLHGTLGDPCSSAADCSTGFCSDGRCCDTACDGACNACSVRAGAGREGECMLLPAGSAGVPACAPFVCSGTSPVCASVSTTTCSTDTDCPENDFCTATSICQPRKAVGRACEPAAGADCKSDGCRVCSSGHCIDGFCCNTSCEAGCQSCAAAFTGQANGTCAPVRPDSDPKDACSAAPGFPGSCGADGQCDGSGSCRSFALEGTVCDDLSCSGNEAKDFTCDGNGHCVAETIACTPGGGSGGSGGSSGGGSGNGSGGSGTSGGSGGAGGSSGSGGSGGSGGGGACETDNGGCDPLTTCTDSGSGRSCGVCPSGYAGTGETGCTPAQCVGTSCACARVSQSGDDASALASNGSSVFSTIQTAIDFVAAHRDRFSSVCVAAGADCGASASFAAPAQLRDGISVIGNYEEATWTQCESSTTRLVLAGSSSITFGSDIVTPTALDGFTIDLPEAPVAIAVSVDGARGALLRGIEVADAVGFRSSPRSYGVNVRNGSVVLARCRIRSFFSVIEAIGVRALSSKVVIDDGTTIEVEGRGSVTGVTLEDSPGSRIEDSSVVALGSGDADDVETRAVAVDVSGDAGGVVIEHSDIDASRGRLETRAISLFGCHGTAPRISDNTLSAQGPLREGVDIRPDVYGIRSVDDCRPHVASNTIQVRTGNESSAFGVACFDFQSVRSSCTLTDNVVSIQNESSALGISTGGIGVMCNDACAEVSRNQISGLAITSCFRDCNYVSIGLDVFRTGQPMLVDSNEIEGGCGGGPIGLNGFGATGVRATGLVRLQNNRIYGSRCETLDHVARTYGVLVNNFRVDIHSNYIEGGRADAPACTSAGISIAETGAPLIRNNVITRGDCFSGANIDEQVSDGDPVVVENNDFVTSPLGTVLYRDQGDVDPKTPDEVDALPDTEASGNFSARCELPLDEGSPCVDRGTTNDAPAHDEQGEPRSSTLPDVGPDEWGDRPTQSPLSCTGTGLVHVLPNECLHDGGNSSIDDALEVYCVAGRARFCLSFEACPWRDAPVDTEETCSRAGLTSPGFPTYLANAWCSLWKEQPNYACDLTGQIFFPPAGSGPFGSP